MFHDVSCIYVNVKICNIYICFLMYMYICMHMGAIESNLTIYFCGCDHSCGSRHFLLSG